MIEHKIGQEIILDGSKYKLVAGCDCKDCCFNNIETCHDMPECDAHGGHYILVGSILPTADELHEKAKHYTDVQCNLQNFMDVDEIELARLKYMDGYIQAINDLVNKDYNPILK